MTREMGKPLDGDARRRAGGDRHRVLRRRGPPAVRPAPCRPSCGTSGRWRCAVPIGVCGIITPLNFPMAIPTWKMFPALVCGNACVFKPAEDVPLPPCNLVEILLEAGLPPEVVNSCTDSAEAGAPLVEHPGRSRHLVHRIDRGGAHRRRDVRRCTSLARSRWAARTP